MDAQKAAENLSKNFFSPAENIAPHASVKSPAREPVPLFSFPVCPLTSLARFESRRWEAFLLTSFATLNIFQRIAVLRIDNPEPRGNAVSANAIDRAIPKLPPQL